MLVDERVKPTNAALAAPGRRNRASSNKRRKMKKLKLLTLLTIITITSANLSAGEKAEEKPKSGCNKCGARKRARREARLTAQKAAREKIKQK
jgi:hypothetical protein